MLAFRPVRSGKLAILSVYRARGQQHLSYYINTHTVPPRNFFKCQSVFFKSVFHFLHYHNGVLTLVGVVQEVFNIYSSLWSYALEARLRSHSNSCYDGRQNRSEAVMGATSIKEEQGNSVDSDSLWSVCMSASVAGRSVYICF